MQILGAIDDEMGLDEVGAVPRSRAMVRRPAPRAAQNLIPQVPGVPEPAIGKKLPFGLGSTTFSASSGTSLSLTAQPQIPIRVERLVIAISRTGTTSTGLVTLTDLKVGTKSQFAGTGAVSADAFANTAVGCELLGDPAGPGINVTANLAISAAPTTTDTVVVNVTIIGTAIG